jgi:hypothetical protein
MDLRNLNISPKALEIASKKSRFWEHHLYVQLLSDELNEARLALQDETLTRERLTSRYLALIEENLNDAILEILHLVKSKLNIVRDLATSMKKYLPQNSEEAFGPPGIAGDPGKIKILSKKYASDYFDVGCRWGEMKAMFDVVDQCLSQVKVNDPRKAIIEELGNQCLNVIGTQKAFMLQMDGLGPFILKAVNANIAGNSTLRTYKLSQAEIDLNETRREVMLDNKKYQETTKSNFSSVKSNKTSRDFDSIFDVYKWLASQDKVLKIDLRRSLLTLSLLIGAVVEDINEKALQISGDLALIESGETFEVNKAVMQMILDSGKDCGS